MQGYKYQEKEYKKDQNVRIRCWDMKKKPTATVFHSSAFVLQVFFELLKETTITTMNAKQYFRTPGNK